MVRPLHNAVVLITGASRGIGRAIALELARAGASVMLTARNAAALEAVAGEARESAAGSGTEVQTLAVDLTDDGAAEQLRDALARAYGRVDLLVNNAGVAKSAPFVETGLELLREHVRINLEAPFVLTQTVLPLLQKAAKGNAKDGEAGAVVVNIASVVAHKGYAEQSAYAASKHALLGFTKAAGKELANLGIRMHAVSPGGTATDMIQGVRPDLDPAGLIYPEAVAKSVRFLYELGGNAAIDELRLRRGGGTPFA